MGSAALAAAELYPGKATQISRNGIYILSSGRTSCHAKCRKRPKTSFPLNGKTLEIASDEQFSLSGEFALDEWQVVYVFQKEQGADCAPSPTLFKSPQTLNAQIFPRRTKDSQNLDMIS